MNDVFAPHAYIPALRSSDMGPVSLAVHRPIRKWHKALLVKNGKEPIELCKLAGKMPYALVQYGGSGSRWQFNQAKPTIEELMLETAELDRQQRRWRIVNVSDGLILSEG